MEITFAYGVEPNQIIVHTETVDLGAYRREQYDGLVNEDLTATWVLPRVLSWEFQAYLNRYFTGWRLLRRVIELRRHAAASPYKKVHYVVQVGTDADAVTLGSHIKKNPYGIPCHQSATTSPP